MWSERLRRGKEAIGLGQTAVKLSRESEERRADRWTCVVLWCCGKLQQGSLSVVPNGMGDRR